MKPLWETTRWNTAGHSNCEDMRVFVAGATGAVGSRLIPLLVSAGHSVLGLTRNAW
jgi:NADPH:quinone reductase-like Zn-dependent oxidoreductase